MRTIFIIPKMFTEREVQEWVSEVPRDFNQKSKEFWEYVEDRLRSQRHINILYYDSLVLDEREKAVEFVKKSHEQCYNIVQRYNDAGAQLRSTEDSVLVQETASWASMLRTNENDIAAQEMLVKNMVDRDRYVAQKISESLKDGETGILFLSPGRRIGEYLASDIRAIKIQPFDPTDYLNSWIVTLSLRSKVSATTL
jgi:hypothetical protein